MGRGTAVPKSVAQVGRHRVRKGRSRPPNRHPERSIHVASTKHLAPTSAPTHERERGQVVVLFALCLVVMVAIAGMLLDGGMASANRRQAQAAADTSALAAAKAYATGGDATAAAQ